MADSHHEDCKDFIFDTVYHAVIALANTVQFSSRELLATMWAWIYSE